MTRHLSKRAAFIAAGMLACSLTSGCGDDPEMGEAAAPLHARRSMQRPGAAAVIAFWDVGATIRWNEIARALVAQNLTPPPKAARAYALLSVAQYEALVAWEKRGRLSAHAVVAGASFEVLSALFPSSAPLLDGKRIEDEASRRWASIDTVGAVRAGDLLGRKIAREVLAEAADDGSDAVWTGTVPVGPGLWTGVSPVLPLWGEVRTWLVPDVLAVRPPAPPAFGSAAFESALDEVRSLSDHRTPEQLAIAQLWADGAGTSTPPGHWNAIASDLIRAEGLDELSAARVLAALNMAEMDAGICCWDAKYAYWLIRPYQADPAITTPVGRPNFPAYTSGHSTFSGAAAQVLAHVFPDHAAELQAMADEAGLSRLYGGIHFRFDSEQGLLAGRRIGDLAIDWLECETP
jgi:hypothetical protein